MESTHGHGGEPAHMTTDDPLIEAVETLQQLGLKEYEARCFVGLTRLSTATAKRLDETTDVPRTRVYDAIRVLEAQGLVEVQHSSPQRFRAVPIPEAVATLRAEYEARIDRLEAALGRLDRADPDGDDAVQEVWSMTGERAVANRAAEIVAGATEEVFVVHGGGVPFTDEFVDVLAGVGDEVDLLVGAVSESLHERVRETVPRAATFVSGLDWLRADDDGPAIGRFLLVDRSALLVSTISPTTGEEHAIFGDGFENGLVVLLRRLMAQGAIPAEDPAEP